jgi:hypothetical protein
MFDNLIGKKIRVSINDRDINGKVIPNRFTSIDGICTFAGYNTILEVWQVTIGRTPIFPIQFKNVEILNKKKLVKSLDF